jgi:hypothetical protein
MYRWEGIDMRDWIAGALIVLGTLLVLGGATTIISGIWFNRPTVQEAPTVPTPYGAAEKAKSLLRDSPANQLIFWGIILLVIAAVATGAIGFDLGAAAPAK